MNRTTRTTRLVAATASVSLTFLLLQSIFSLFASAPAQQQAKAHGAATVVASTR